jgi:hypothetical protein
LRKGNHGKYPDHRHHDHQFYEGKTFCVFHYCPLALNMMRILGRLINYFHLQLTGGAAFR